MEPTDTVESDGTIGLSAEEADRLVGLYLQTNKDAVACLKALVTLDVALDLIHRAHELIYADGGTCRVEVPELRPSWVDDSLVKETLFTLSPRYPKPITGVTAVEIIERVGRLADVLEGGGA